MMRILIGGSSSTGSSLLKTILGRHNDIFAGSETSLFTKKKLYEDYQHSRSRILKRFPKGLRSHSYHIYNGVDLEHAEYGWKRHELKHIINHSETFPMFADSFFARGMENYGKKHWLEKTPGNAYLFYEFLTGFSNSKVIHITRHPTETIFSLIKRGYNLLEACGIYLLNTSAALTVHQHPDYYELKYEDLITDTRGSIQGLLDFIGLEFQDNMLESSNPYKIKETRISTWNYDETDPIVRSKRLIPEKIKNHIEQAMNKIQVSKAGINHFRLATDNFKTLLNLIGYEFLPFPVSKDVDNMLRSQIRRDKWIRLRKFYATGFHYPLSIQ